MTRKVDGDIIYYIFSLTSPKSVFGQQNSNWPRDQLHNITNCHHLSRGIVGASFKFINMSRFRNLGGGGGGEFGVHLQAA